MSKINNVLSHNCIAGTISQYILKGQYENAKKEALMFQELFNNDFYLELMPHLGRQAIVNEGLVKLHNDLKIPLILTADSHYVNAEDKDAHDMLLCIQQRTTLDNPKRWRFEEGFYYLNNRQGIIDLFQKHHPYIPLNDLEEACDNTVKIAEQCNVEFVFGKHFLPKVDPYIEIERDPEIKRQFNQFEARRFVEIAKRENVSVEEASKYLDPSSEYIRFLCIHSWNGLYQQGFLDKKHLSLLMYELDVIITMGFPSYFAILYEILYWCQHPHSLTSEHYKDETRIFSGFSRGCFGSEEIVDLFIKGKTPISKVQINDKVLGYDNQYHLINQVYEYDVDEELVQIKTKDQKINYLTKDHKVLAVKQDDYVENKEYTMNDLNKNGLRWYPVDELDVNDYMFVIK